MRALAPPAPAYGTEMEMDWEFDRPTRDLPPKTPRVIKGDEDFERYLRAGEGGVGFTSTTLLTTPPRPPAPRPALPLAEWVTKKQGPVEVCESYGEVMTRQLRVKGQGRIDPDLIQWCHAESPTLRAAKNASNPDTSGKLGLVSLGGNNTLVCTGCEPPFSRDVYTAKNKADAQPVSVYHHHPQCPPPYPSHTKRSTHNTLSLPPPPPPSQSPPRQHHFCYRQIREDIGPTCRGIISHYLYKYIHKNFDQVSD